jgi:hypothetical protein
MKIFLMRPDQNFISLPLDDFNQNNIREKEDAAEKDFNEKQNVRSN